MDFVSTAFAADTAANDDPQCLVDEDNGELTEFQNSDDDDGGDNNNHGDLQW